MYMILGCCPLMLGLTEANGNGPCLYILFASILAESHYKASKFFPSQVKKIGWQLYLVEAHGWLVMDFSFNMCGFSIKNHFCMPLHG